MVLLALPKAAEYAIKILVCLALSTGRPVSAGEAARCVRIPPSQAAKVLHFLRWAGLARSRRGSNGGYLLKQCAEETTVEQVMRLFSLTPDEEPGSPADPLLEVFSQAAARSQKDWEQLTIAELARRTADRWECSTCVKHEAPAGNN
jgi:Rrf2 family protein